MDDYMKPEAIDRIARREVASAVHSWVVDETDWFWESDEYEYVPEDNWETFVTAVQDRAAELVGLR